MTDLSTDTMHPHVFQFGTSATGTATNLTTHMYQVRSAVHNSSALPLLELISINIVYKLDVDFLSLHCTLLFPVWGHGSLLHHSVFMCELRGLSHGQKAHLFSDWEACQEQMGPIPSSNGSLDIALSIAQS